ncbi:MAG: hypothetical protein U9Q03_01085 [Patescibacteria group bacterium]|nr:hypothetical protein [Patescibacteria group bacterium]
MKVLQKLALIPMLILLCAPLWLAPAPAVAGGVDLSSQLTNVGEAAYGETGETDLAVIIGGVIQAAFGLLGIVLLVLILYGGYLWMTAGGNEEQVGKAKKIITNAVIGLVIIMAAYAIANFVVGAITESTT